MLIKKIATTIVAATFAFAPVSPVVAGNDLVGGIIGGIIGSAIFNGANTRRRVVVVRSSYTREVQTSLNYFGFPSGTPDGVLGRKSRAAISAFQAFMLYPVTGRLLDHEQSFLLASFNRAQAGGYATSQLIAEQELGVRGLLVVYREELAGGQQNFAGRTIGGLPPKVSASVFEIAKSSDPTAEQLIQRAGFIQLADLNNDGRTDYILDTSVAGSSFWCNADNCAVRVFVSTPDGYKRNDFQAFNVVPAMFTCQRGNCVKNGSGDTLQLLTPAPSTLPPVVQVAAPALPNFMALAAPVKTSLGLHCSQVSLLTNSNGGLITENTMGDAWFALNEQFCLARTYAIAAGEELASQLPGVSNAQLESQCAAFGPAMKSILAALSVKPNTQVMQEVSGFVLSTGMSQEQLANTAKICLAVGYRTDHLDVALGSALLLTVLAEPAYGELLGHHLLQGYGTSEQPELAFGWFADSFAAFDNGAVEVFAPGYPERSALIRKAVNHISENGDRSILKPTQDQVVPVSTLPNFAFQSDN